MVCRILILSFFTFEQILRGERKREKERKEERRVRTFEFGFDSWRGILFTKIMMFADSLPIDPSMLQMISLLWPIKRVFQPKNPPRVGCK